MIGADLKMEFPKWKMLNKFAARMAVTKCLKVFSNDKPFEFRIFPSIANTIAISKSL